MKKFIVSDLYEDKIMYDIIFSYLKKIDDEVLFILNGNMIGLELDIYESMKENGHVHIEYLGGNLELELYQRLKNGQYKEFLGDLNTYYIFQEGIYYRPFLVSHGGIPKGRSSKIKDCCYDTVSRRTEIFDRNYITRQFMGAMGHNKNRNPCYFLIKGGVPIDNEAGFFYNRYEHTLTIDGGCRYYLDGDLRYDHVPLVEIYEGGLFILVFNHSGEIIYQYGINESCKKLVKEFKKNM